MSTMYLFGAGASAAAGIPMATEMTRRIDSVFQERGWTDTLSTYRYVLGGLILQKSVEGHSPYEGLNVEEVYSALELLADRDRLEASPFVSSWHPTVDQLDRRMEAYRFEQLAQAIRLDIQDLLRDSIPFPTTDSREHMARFNATRADQAMALALETGGGIAKVLGREVERAISAYLQDWNQELKELIERLPRDSSGVTKAISDAMQSATSQGTGMAFRSTCEAVLSVLSGLTSVSDASEVEYLRPLFQSAGKSPITIATLNYDNTVELVCQELNLEVETGLERWNQEGAFRFDGGAVRLMKLHGSVSWKTEQQRDRYGLTHETVHEVPVDADGISGYRPVLVFGQREKLRAGGPFLDLLTAFRSELLRTETLVVAGYSFRDEHINDSLSHWLMTGKRWLTIVSPSVPEGEFAQSLLSEGPFESVRHIAKPLAEAIADGDLNT